jgi:activator of 2-hydroxyglutaryl-CoA dehydratase
MDKKIKSFTILRSGAVYKGVAETALNEALSKAGLEFMDLHYIVSTGLGITLNISEEPQIAGAMGAALIACEKEVNS